MNKVKLLEETLDQLLAEMSAGPAPNIMTLPGDPIQRNPRDINSAAYAAEREAGKMETLRKLRRYIIAARYSDPASPEGEAYNSALRRISEFFNLDNL